MSLFPSHGNIFSSLPPSLFRFGPIRKSCFCPHLTRAVYMFLCRGKPALDCRWYCFPTGPHSPPFPWESAKAHLSQMSPWAHGFHFHLSILPPPSPLHSGGVTTFLVGGSFLVFSTRFTFLLHLSKSWRADEVFFNLSLSLRHAPRGSQLLKFFRFSADSVSRPNQRQPLNPLQPHVPLALSPYHSGCNADS